MHCPTEDHLKCHHSCLATSFGSHFPKHNRPQKKKKKTPTMFLYEGTICSHAHGNNMRQCCRLRHGHTGGWGRRENTIVKVKTNRVKHLSCPSHACLLKSSLASLTQNLRWHPHRGSVAPWQTCTILQDTQMLHCNLFRTEGGFYLNITLLVWSEGAPTPTPSILNNSSWCSSNRRMNVSFLYRWLCCGYPCTRCLPRCDGE